MSNKYYYIKCNFVYGSIPAYFNYQKIMGEAYISFTASYNIALFYDVNQIEEAELYLLKNLKKHDVKYYTIERV
jgi:hypothetical protein